MKISTKGRYGLRILLDLALHQDGKPRLLRDIAESQQISEKYISRLIIELRKAHLVRSIRGAKGGFQISKKPEELTLFEVIEVMEGPLAIVDCVRAPEKCGRHNLCATRLIWDRLNSEIRDAMRKITLADILDKDCARNAEDGFFDYCI